MADLSAPKSRRAVAWRRVSTIATISAASALAAIVAFIVSILSARVLGPTGRGEVATVLQCAYLAAPLVGFGADRLLLRRDSKGHGFIPSTWAMLLVAALVAAVVALVYGPWQAMAAAVALVTVSFAFARATAISQGTIGFFVYLFAAFQGSVLIISAGLWLANVTDWRWWAAAYLFPALPLALWALSHTRRTTGVPAAGIATVARHNAPFMFSSLGALATTRLDRVLLPVLASPAALGLYIVVATATEPLYWVAQSIADQRTSDASRATAASKSVWVRLGVVAAIYAALGGIGGWLLYLLIVPIFGPDFAPAQQLVAPLALAAVALGCYRYLCGEILGGTRPRLLGRVEAIAAVIAVVCYPVGIIWGAALGAAWASVVVYLAAGLVAVVALRRAEKTPPVSTQLAVTGQH